MTLLIAYFKPSGRFSISADSPDSVEYVPAEHAVTAPVQFDPPEHKVSTEKKLCVALCCPTTIFESS